MSIAEYMFDRTSDPLGKKLIRIAFMMRAHKVVLKSRLHVLEAAFILVLLFGLPEHWMARLLMALLLLFVQHIVPAVVAHACSSHEDETVNHAYDTARTRILDRLNAESSANKPS